MNLMQLMTLMGQGGGAIARAGMPGPLSPRQPRPGAGPLAIGAGTMAQQLPQPLERIDPDVEMQAALAASNPAPAPAAMAPPEINSETFKIAASLPGRGPLAMAGPAPATATPAAPQRKGVFSRLGDFLGSDEGKGAFLRGGAALLSGGSLGDAVATGAAFVDGRRKERMDQAVQEREFGQRDRQLDISQQGTDQQGLYQAGQLQNQANRNVIDMMEAEQRAKEQVARLKLDWAKLSQAEKEFLITSQLRAAEEAGRNARHSSVSGSTRYASDSATARNDKTIAAADRRAGGDNLGEIVTTTKEVKGEEPGWFSSGTPGQPATTTKTKIRALPPSPSADNLIPGAVYATARGTARWNGTAFEEIE